MALNPSIMSKLIIGQCAAQGLVGTDIPKFSKAFSKGLINSFKSMNKVITVDAGVMTVGSGKGKMTGLVPGTLVKLTKGLMAGSGIAGTQMSPMADAVCNAVVTHFNAMNEVETTHSTVALGSGVGKVSGLVPSVMEAKIMQEMLGQNFKGTMLYPLVSAFSKAFCTNVMAVGVVNVVITGSPAPLVLGVPIPSGGSGVGKIK